MNKVILILLLFWQIIFAQKDNKKVVDSLIVLAKQNSGTNPQKMQEFCKYASELAQKINYKKGLADATRFYGASFYLQGNFKEAENNFLKALKLNEEIKDTRGIMACLSNLGSVNNVQNKYTDALNYYQKAVRIG